MVDLDTPLFPGYVFARFTPQERVKILRTPGVVAVVGFSGVPAAIPDCELESIRAALASKLTLTAWPYLRTGDRVRIEFGPLRGVEGTLVSEPGGVRLILSVDLLQRSLAVEVEPESIVPVGNATISRSPCSDSPPCS